MKVAVVFLLVAVGVASAAFSASLVEQTQPLLNQASLQATIAASSLTRGNKGLADFFNSLANAVISQVNAIIAQIMEHATTLGGHVTNLSAAAQAQAHMAIAMLQNAASMASGQVLETIQGMITNLQNMLSGNGKAMETEMLVARLDLPAILQNALQAALHHLMSNEEVAALIEQLTPFVNYVPGLGSLLDQLAAVMLGNGKLNRAAPAFVQNLMAQFQQIIGVVQAATADAIAQAQVLAQQLINQAMNQGTAIANLAIQQLQAQLPLLQSMLGEAGRPLIEAIQNLLNKP